MGQYPRYDPNTGNGGDEVEIARWISPTNSAGAFNYTGLFSPVRVGLRTGDPVGIGGDAESDLRTGRGKQGFEINITIAPRT